MVARARVGGLSAGPSPNPPRIRVGGLSAAVGAATSTRARVGGLSAAVGAAAGIRAFTPVACEPFTVVSLTAVTALGSPTPTTYAWSVIAGTAVTINGTGATVTVVAPAGKTAAGATTTIRCTPLVSGVPGIPQDVTITTPQHLRWQMTGPSTLTAVRLPVRV